MKRISKPLITVKPLSALGASTQSSGLRAQGSGKPTNPKSEGITENTWQKLLRFGTELKREKFLGKYSHHTDTLKVFSSSIPSFYIPCTTQEIKDGYHSCSISVSACSLVTKNPLGLNYFQGTIIRIQSLKGFKYIFIGENQKDFTQALKIHLSAKQSSVESLPETNTATPHISYTSRIGLVDTEVLVIPQKNTEDFKKIAIQQTITQLANEVPLKIENPEFFSLFQRAVNLGSTYFQTFTPETIKKSVAQLINLRGKMPDSSFTACLKPCLQGLNKTQRENLTQHFEELCTRNDTVSENCKLLLTIIQSVEQDIQEEETALFELQKSMFAASPSQKPGNIASSSTSASISDATRNSTPSSKSAAASSSESVPASTPNATSSSDSTPASQRLNLDEQMQAWKSELQSSLASAEEAEAVAASLPSAPLHLPSVPTQKAVKKEKGKDALSLPSAPKGMPFFGTRKEKAISGLPDELGLPLLAEQQGKASVLP